MKSNSELRFAVLIDAENVPPSNIKGVLEEIAKYGIPTLKRIGLEGCPSGKCHNPYSAVQLYVGKKFFGLGHDYRRNGHPIFQ